MPGLEPSFLVMEEWGGLTIRRPHLPAPPPHTILRPAYLAASTQSALG